jgi:DNA-binding transcriptional LysR family regulator
MELRHLRYFVAVCDTLHFGRAAEMMRVAQPALSQQIRNLELELGVDLFWRTKRNVELTPAGAVFARRARLILGNVKSAVHEVRDVGAGLEQQLRVGVLSSIQLAQLTPLLAQYRKTYPEVRLHIAQFPSHRQLDDLAAGSLDVGFVDTTSSMVDCESHGTAFSSMDVLAEELMVAVPNGHRLSALKQIELIDLADEPFVLTESNSVCSLSARVRSLCDVSGFTPTIYTETFDLPSALALVASGYAVTLAPACAIVQWRKHVCFISLVPRPTINVSMVWRSDDESVHLDAFCQAVSEFKGEHPQFFI